MQLPVDMLQSKESRSQKDLCVDELVNTEEKFVAALQMIQEVSGCMFRPLDIVQIAHA